MNGQKWVKLWVDFLDNEKILSIFSSGFCSESDRETDEKLTESCKVPDKKRDTILMIWVQILCLAGKLNAGGVLRITETMPYTPKLLADRIRRKVADVRLALEVFSNLGMIEVVDGFVVIKNWSRYQGSETEDRKREYNRERMRETRANERKKSDNSCDNKKTTVRQQLSLQKKEEEKDKENTTSDDVVQKKSADVVAALDDGGGEKRGSEFVPPTLAQVKAACEEHKLKVDPARFVDYFTQRRWAGVTDWRARLLSWDSNPIEDAKAKARPIETESSFDTDDYFANALIRAYGDEFAESYLANGG